MSKSNKTFFNVKLLRHVFYVHIMHVKAGLEVHALTCVYTSQQGTNIYGFYDAHDAVQIITPFHGLQTYFRLRLS